MAEKKEPQEPPRCNKCNKILSSQEIISYAGRCEDCFSDDQDYETRKGDSKEN